MPIPETELALSLNKAGILNSMIDISDGFLQDALHLCQASKVKFVISEKALPLYNSEFLKEGERLEGLSSGDDYALLFTSSISASEKDSFDTLSRCIPIGYVKDYSQNGFIDISIDESNKTIQSLEEYLLRNKLDPKKLGYSHL
jgi:thiamine monophosphate kinase